MSILSNVAALMSLSWFGRKVNIPLRRSDSTSLVTLAATMARDQSLHSAEYFWGVEDAVLGGSEQESSCEV